MIRKIYGRLSGRIAGAHQSDFLGAAQLRFERGRPIMHARTLEGLQTLDREAPIASAGRNHDDARSRPLIIRELKSHRPLLRLPTTVDAPHFIGYRHLDPELLRLIVSTRHES